MGRPRRPGSSADQRSRESIWPPRRRSCSVTDFQKKVKAEPVEQGIGAPGRETNNHFAAIRKVRGRRSGSLGARGSREAEGLTMKITDISIRKVDHADPRYPDQNHVRPFVDVYLQRHVAGNLESRSMPEFRAKTPVEPAETQRRPDHGDRRYVQFPALPISGFRVAN